MWWCLPCFFFPCMSRVKHIHHISFWWALTGVIAAELRLANDCHVSSAEQPFSKTKTLGFTKLSQWYIQLVKYLTDKSYVLVLFLVIFKDLLIKMISCRRNISTYIVKNIIFQYLIKDWLYPQRSRYPLTLKDILNI